MGEFTHEEWESIFAELKKDPKTYGFPIHTPGSALMGSFNIRKLGNPENRSNDTWKFLGLCCKCYDIIAIQEALDNMDGLYRLLDELDGEYKMICSDKTGTYPGDSGLGERMVFFYRPATVDLGEVVSDVTYDRTKVNQVMFEHLDEIVEAKNEYERDMEDYLAGRRKSKPTLEAPIFMSFIRQPFCSSFIIKGENEEEYEPFKLMAINAHLMYGTSQDRWREFEALMHWIRDRVVNQEKMYFPNYVLLGDLNLDYNDPEKDFVKMEELVKNIDGGTADEIQINFPFLGVHPNEEEHFTSNIVLTQRYDQIGMFFSDSDGEGRGFPTKKENETMGKHEDGPDYGVFNFTELFAKALEGESFKEMSKTSQKAFVKRYAFEVSDHMPIWLRLKFSPKSTSNKRMKMSIPTFTSYYK